MPINRFATIKQLKITVASLLSVITLLGIGTYIGIAITDDAIRENQIEGCIRGNIRGDRFNQLSADVRVLYQALGTTIDNVSPKTYELQLIANTLDVLQRQVTTVGKVDCEKEFR